ncbi:GntR family transcriptional regulator [Agromyces albus]|uniref:GntR family transcriptional regulator n=1 Tax=Agromyces albus TaxID=205332 RepID=UPI002789F2B5|nr:GntR family transcriptional regulator [Agromyces albus]MDQ0577577.1 DNA-binding transcriptional regulator YhcF (GntR family) [Agromyces albus]
MFEVDPSSAVAPFEQIRVQVIEAVRSGDLAPGSRMPTVRRLAEELGLAANTVARAYRELEHDGVIETRGRNGSFVSATGDPVRQQAQLAASAYADHIARLGVDAEDALVIVRSALGLPAQRG